MTKNRLAAQASGTVLVALIAGFGVSCQKTAPAAPTSLAQASPPVATLPLSDVPAQTYAMAPPVSALPAYRVRRARVARPQDEYAFADRADQASYGFGDAPPDYAFDYQGGRPWDWQGDDGHQVVVEPLPGGADRYYYYQPGASTPYFVRDRDYAYGYQDGALVVVYDRFGRPLPQAEQDRRWDDAGRYAWRAQALWRAARGQHYAVARSNWQSRRDAIDQSRSQWTQARDQNPDWRAYHDQNGTADQSFWEQERYRREAEAYRVDQASNDAGRAQHDREAAFAVAGAAAVGGAFLAAHHDHGPQGRAAPAAFAGQPAPVNAPPAPPPGAFAPAPPHSAGQIDPRAQMAARQAAHSQANAATTAQMAAQARLHDEALARQAAVTSQQQAARQASAQARAQRVAEQTQQAQAARQAGVQAQATRQAQASIQAKATREALAARDARIAGQAQAQAARQAQAQAARQAQAQAGVQATRQAQAARDARIAGQAQAQAARQAQAQAARQAQVQSMREAQTQAQALAARQAQVQAARQAQAQSVREAQTQAQASRQAQAQAARQAQVQAARLAQAQSMREAQTQAQASRHAQAQAARQAQVQATQANARAAQDARLQAQQSAREAAIAKQKAERTSPPSRPGEKTNTPNP